MATPGHWLGQQWAAAARPQPAQAAAHAAAAHGNGGLERAGEGRERESERVEKAGCRSFTCARQGGSDVSTDKPRGASSLHGWTLLFIKFKSQFYLKKATEHPSLSFHIS